MFGRFVWFPFCGAVFVCFVASMCFFGAAGGQGGSLILCVRFFGSGWLRQFVFSFYFLVVFLYTSMLQ